MFSPFPSLRTDLQRRRLRVVLATIGVNLAGVSLLNFVSWSNWRTGLALNLIDNAMLLGFIVRNRDATLARFILFGLVTGFAELAADAWLVDRTHTLDYSVGGGPMLWRSPAWMPFAWEIVVVQFGYIGMLLYERFGVVGALFNGVLGAINIPYYEKMARLIHWWTYRDCRMISGTPWYIILGEFQIAFWLALLGLRVRHGLRPSAITMGLLGGAAIYVSYVASYRIIEG